MTWWVLRYVSALNDHDLSLALPILLVYKFLVDIRSNAGNQDLNNQAEQQNRKRVAFPKHMKGV
jgi:hypothetical protein